MKSSRGFGAASVFLDVDAGFFAEDQAQQRLEDAATVRTLAILGPAAVADEEAARHQRLDFSGRARRVVGGCRGEKKALGQKNIAPWGSRGGLFFFSRGW